jgi:hypothetical protein
LSYRGGDPRFISKRPKKPSMQRTIAAAVAGAIDADNQEIRDHFRHILSTKYPGPTVVD